MPWLRSHSTARSLALRSLNWKKCASCFGCLRSAFRNASGLDEASAKAIVRELKAVGGDLRALRVALTGAEHGPELWAVVAAMPRDEAIARARLASGRGA